MPLDEPRYARQLLMPEIGPEGQARLAKAKVLVVGAGGLGSPVLYYLTAAGVGTIGVADCDVVSLSNLQRQILYAEEDIGLAKPQAAKARLVALNRHTAITPYAQRLDGANVRAIVSQYDMVVDATDNYATRCLLDEATSALGIPLIYGAIEGFRGQCAVLNMPPAGASYRALFPTPPTGTAPSPIGVVGATAGTIGSVQASQALQLALGHRPSLANQLLVVDLWHGSWETYSIPQ